MISDDYLKYPKRRYGMDHDRYDWSILSDRKPIQWPGGARIALWVTVSLQWFPLDQQGKPFKPLGSLQTAYPDLRHYTLRDYGNRVGIYRIMKALERHGIRASAPVNAAVAARYPSLVKEIAARGWELVGHGLDMDRLHYEGMADEAAAISRSLEILRKHGKVRGWLSPAKSESHQTLDLLAGAGIEYVCDWVNDDMPYPMRARAACTPCRIPTTSRTRPSCSACATTRTSCATSGSTTSTCCTRRRRRRADASWCCRCIPGRSATHTVSVRWKPCWPTSCSSRASGRRPARKSSTPGKKPRRENPGRRRRRGSVRPHRRARCTGRGRGSIGNREGCLSIRLDRAFLRLRPAAPTRFQGEGGDSAELMSADIQRKNHGEANGRIVDAVCRASGPAIEWLADRHGIPFQLVEGFLYPGHSVERMHCVPEKAGAALMVHAF